MIQKAASHIFIMVKIIFHHLKSSTDDLCYRKPFVVGFLSRDERSRCGQGEEDVGIRHHQDGLELCQVDIQGSVKSKRSSNGGHSPEN